MKVIDILDPSFLDVEKGGVEGWKGWLGQWWESWVSVYAEQGKLCLVSTSTHPWPPPLYLGSRSQVPSGVFHDVASAHYRG